MVRCNLLLTDVAGQCSKRVMAICEDPSLWHDLSGQLLPESTPQCCLPVSSEVAVACRSHCLGRLRARFEQTKHLMHALEWKPESTGHLAGLPVNFTFETWLCERSHLKCSAARNKKRAHPPENTH